MKKMRKRCVLMISIFLVGCVACSPKNKVSEDVKETTPTPAAEENVYETFETPPAEKEESKNTTEDVLGRIKSTYTLIKENEVTETEELKAKVVMKDQGIVIEGTGCTAQDGHLSITEEGAYEISGAISDGSIYVNVGNDKEVHLIFNGVAIHNETGSAVFCKKVSKVTITLAADTVNILTDGKEYVLEEGEEEPDATLYAKHDLVLNGTGTLEVKSGYKDAIKGKDSLYILGGTYSVEAQDDGIVGRDLLCVEDGYLRVTAVSDAMKATNDTEAASGNVLIMGGDIKLIGGDDSLQAENTLIVSGGTVWAEAEMDALQGKTVEITGGDITISAGDDGVKADETIVIRKKCKVNIIKSKEGVEAAEVTILGGELSVIASDDGINISEGSKTGQAGGMRGKRFTVGNGKLLINGGKIVVDAKGDGLDANGNIEMNGGEVVVYGPVGGGNGVLDFDGSFLVNGGTLFCIGSSSMAQMPGDGSGQYSLAVAFEESIKPGSLIAVLVNGENVLSYSPVRSSDYLVVSYGSFVKDAVVSILADGKECYSGTLAECVTCFGQINAMGGFGFGGGKGGEGDRLPMPGGERPGRPSGEKKPGERPDKPQGEKGEWGFDMFPEGNFPEEPSDGFSEEESFGESSNV